MSTTERPLIETRNSNGWYSTAGPDPECWKETSLALRALRMAIAEEYLGRESVAGIGTMEAAGYYTWLQGYTQLLRIVIATAEATHRPYSPSAELVDLYGQLNRGNDG